MKKSADSFRSCQLLIREMLASTENPVISQVYTKERNTTHFCMPVLVKHEVAPCSM